MPRRNKNQIESMQMFYQKSLGGFNLRTVFTRNRNKPLGLRGTTIPYTKEGYNIRRK